MYDSPARTVIYNGPDGWAYRKRLLSELPHKKKDGFAYSNYLPWSDKVPDWVREGKGSGKEQRKSGIGHGYDPPPTPFLLYVVIFSLAVFSRDFQKFTPSLDKNLGLHR